MPDDLSRDLLNRGVSAAREGRADDARKLLTAFLALETSIESRIDAWRALADLADSPAEKRDYIGRILTVDPTDGLARRALAVLDGRLDPRAIIDPLCDTPPPDVSSPNLRADRLSCPQCGSGRLVAAPDGRNLVCEHCGSLQIIPHASQRHDPDFAAAIWTAKGHMASAPTYAFVCEGCGAAFLQPPGVQSLTCAFCGSVHVSQEAAARDLIGPTAILPFSASEAEVLASLQSVGYSGTGALVAVFLPIWQFTFAGELRWKGYRYERDGFGSREHKVEVSGTHTVIEHTVLVSATDKLPDSLASMLDRFDQRDLTDFEPSRLAGHAAATCERTLDNASVPARRRALDTLREEVRKEQSDVSGLEVSAGRFGVDSFNLLLLPFWTATVGTGEDRTLVFVNGQTADIGQPRTPGLLSWLSSIVQRIP